MIISQIIDGYSSLDSCNKYTDADSTIDCYVFPRKVLEGNIRTVDWELNTNSVYILVGREDDKTMAYVGKADRDKKGESSIRRIKEHLNKPTEKYFPYWEQAIIFVCKNQDPKAMWKSSDTDDLEALLIADTQSDYSWNSKGETIKNPLTIISAREHSKKLISIKEYISNLNLTFFDKINTDTNNLTYEEKIANQTKEIIDATVNLSTENLASEYNRVPEYTTPIDIVNIMLDLLPWDTYDHTTTFFDPACKGGEFLALIHDRLSQVLDHDPYFNKYNGNEKICRIHDYIINNQLFGIAIGEESYEESLKRVYNCKHIIKVDNKYVGRIKNRDKAYIHQLLGETQNMNFDIIIGNPPYQETTDGGNNGGKAIYPYFIESSLNMSNHVVMIIKNNWLYSDTLKDIRKTIVNNGLRDLINWSKLGEPFSNVGISACIVNMDKNYTGETHYKEMEGISEISHYYMNFKDQPYIPSTEIEASIITKIRSINHQYFGSKMIGSNPFGIDTNGKRTGEEYIDTSANLSSDCNILLKYSDHYEYMNINSIPSNVNIVNKYKIICAKQLHKNSTTISNITGLKPNEICTGSFSLLHYSDNQLEEYNVYKYVSTKFVKFLVYCLSDTLCRVNKYRFSLVPEQDYTSNSDINWSQPINFIDEQLYKKYNLSQEEINHIEKIIKLPDTQNTKITTKDMQANLIQKRIQQEESSDF